MQTLIYFYPAIITMLGQFFYKRDSARMQQFYRRMAVSRSARRLFTLGLLMLMLIANFLYLQIFGVDRMFCVATILCGVMFSFRTSERLINRLHKPEVLGLAFAVMIACVIIPSVWPVSMCLYILTVGSFFYPSKRMIRRLASPKHFSKLASSPDTSIIKDYYSR